MQKFQLSTFSEIATTATTTATTTTTPSTTTKNAGYSFPDKQSRYIKVKRLKI